MSDIALMSDVDAAAVRAATNIVTLESIKHDREELLNDLLGMRVNHKRIAAGFEALVASVSREAPESYLTEINCYCPLNCTTKYGPAPRQRPALLVDVHVSERDSLVARVGDRTVIARPSVHRDEQFYALYATTPLVMNLLNHYGKQGRDRLERAVHALSSARVSFQMG